LEIEYTLCQIQSGQISLAAKTHRQQGGDPRLSVTRAGQSIQWVLTNLVDGDPETIVGVPRQNHIDFYFLLDALESGWPQLLQPVLFPDDTLRLPSINPAGTERPGGLPIRMGMPAHRYQVDSVELFVMQAPDFHAVGQQPILHLDIETTPPSLYGQEMIEIHFGIQADFEIVGQYDGGQSYAVVTMTEATYATIYDDVQNLLAT
jgi:hypothetical protein